MLKKKKKKKKRKKKKRDRLSNRLRCNRTQGSSLPPSLPPSCTALHYRDFSSHVGASRTLHAPPNAHPPRVNRTVEFTCTTGSRGRRLVGPRAEWSGDHTHRPGLQSAKAKMFCQPISVCGARILFCFGRHLLTILTSCIRMPLLQARRKSLNPAFRWFDTLTNSSRKSIRSHEIQSRIKK